MNISNEEGNAFVIRKKSFWDFFKRKEAVAAPTLEHVYVTNLHTSQFITILEMLRDAEKWYLGKEFQNEKDMYLLIAKKARFYAMDAEIRIKEKSKQLRELKKSQQSK